MSSTRGYILVSSVLLFTGGTLWGLTSCWGASNEVGTVTEHNANETVLHIDLHCRLRSVQVFVTTVC